MEKKTGNVMCAGVVEVRSFSMNAEIERRENEQEKKLMKIENVLNTLSTINSTICYKIQHIVYLQIKYYI